MGGGRTGAAGWRLQALEEYRSLFEDWLLSSPDAGTQSRSLETLHGAKTSGKVEVDVGPQLGVFGYAHRGGQMWILETDQVIPDILSLYYCPPPLGN